MVLFLEFSSQGPFTFIFAGTQFGEDRKAFLCYYCNSWNELNSGMVANYTGLSKKDINGGNDF